MGRRLCFLLKSTRGMCYTRRAGIGCWVATEGKSDVHDTQPRALQIHSSHSSGMCSSFASWDHYALCLLFSKQDNLGPLLLVCRLRGGSGRDAGAMLSCCVLSCPSRDSTTCSSMMFWVMTLPRPIAPPQPIMRL